MMAAPAAEAAVIILPLALVMWAPWQHPQHARSRRRGPGRAPRRDRGRDGHLPASPGGVAASELLPGLEDFPGEWDAAGLRGLHDGPTSFTTSPDGRDGEGKAAMVAGETPARPPGTGVHETAAPPAPSPPPPTANGRGPGPPPPGQGMYCMQDQQDCLPERPCSCCSLQGDGFPCAGECGDPYPHKFCMPPPPVSDDTQEWLNTLARQMPEKERDTKE